MPRVVITYDLDEQRAFDLLLQTLHVKLKEDAPEFIVEDGEIKVKDCDDRGELYLALYHLATKIFPNTEFRGLFDNPNDYMSDLYKEQERQEYGGSE